MSATLEKAPVMAVGELRVLRASTRVAAVLVGLTAVTAVVVHLTLAAPAREWLGFTFSTAPWRAGEAVDIFVNNVRLLGVVLAACTVAQARRRGSDDGVEGAVLGALVISCDAALILGCALHVALVGGGLGAYGVRTLWAILPHGPVELGAFSLGLALYLACRRRRVTPRTIVTTGLAAALGLALAAPLEVLG